VSTQPSELTARL
jgi:hypothetical protein